MQILCLHIFYSWPSWSVWRITNRCVSTAQPFENLSHHFDGTRFSTPCNKSYFISPAIYQDIRLRDCRFQYLSLPVSIDCSSGFVGLLRRESNFFFRNSVYCPLGRIPRKGDRPVAKPQTAEDSTDAQNTPIFIFAPNGIRAHDVAVGGIRYLM
jgi:hypothetical protein